MSYTYSESKIDLIINKVSRAIYKKLQENGNIGENEIYLITDPIMDAANDKIINVADPTDPLDAANKQYVDEHSGVKLSISEDGGKTFNAASEVKFINISAEEYHKLVQSGDTLSNAIYEVDYENNDCFGERLTNVGSPINDSDATTKQYVDSRISNIKVPTKTSDLTNNSGFLTAHQSLSNYYDKTQVNEISAALNRKTTVRVSIPEKGVQTDLSVLNIVKLTKTEYQQREQNGQILSTNLYIVEAGENDILFGGNSFTC